MNKQLTTTLIFALSAGSAMAMLDITLPGNSTQSNWANLNGDVYTEPTYPVFAGSFAIETDPFEAPIAADAGSAEFTKVSGGGLFFPLSFGGSLYNGNTPGTYTIYDNSPIAGLETVVFQTDAGSEMMVAPVLSFNSGAQNLAADFTASVTGDFDTTVYAFQWDLSGIFDTISNYEIVWTTPPHNANYAMQINAGDTFGQAIPEPSTYALILGAACGALLLMRRQRR
ncbi:PEP-CTERM sorting domain-containing protein [Cerasicoccus arenae]|uniref:PEP-CTERM protein-sorting domain-containing protein n=1 Tax=Cerasicoccus arenae TaxID=424488 RepID=A0A8J3D8C1_9BACT|nr:PEP-CTERM sorting domain-containing protein [Cerasicoccus arenae]MBK1859033.1 PEP-CTERM sorting domain-containing protein [Cerasicoccus arenae]GHB94852.1 hypothetical protein GCM10007047_07990 [Cerasicoccus arenae]